MMRKLPFKMSLAILSLALIGINAQAQLKPMDEFVDELMSKMTIEEKIGQLNLQGAWGFISAQKVNSEDENLRMLKNGQLGGLYGMKDVELMTKLQKMAVEDSKHGIPLLFGQDVIHGLETTFPISLAISTSWNLPLIEESARRAAQEATALGINWVFSPMVDICRDARWGRIAEGAGEDPYLGGEIAKAYVYGYQGRDGDLTKNNNVMACVKHYALYGAAEAGRDYNTVSMDRQAALNGFMRPYEEACKAGAGSYMASFNEFESIPATCNTWLLEDVLRKMWGFDGFVVSDATGIMEISNHGLGDLQEVSRLALQAGTDMDMNSNGYIGTLMTSYQEGKVSEADINKACRRILQAKYKLGLFEDPYRYLDPKRAKEVYTQDMKDFARRMAGECQVLLKNDNNLLPLKKDIRIALIGPFADNAKDMQGTWAASSHSAESVTILQGIQAKLQGNGKVTTAEGSWLVYDEELEKTLVNGLMGFFNPNFKPAPVHTRPMKEMIDEAVSLAKEADVIIAALGESNSMNGEGASRSDITIPGPQKDLLKALEATGKPIVLVLTTGRPLALSWENENIDAILNTWSQGDQAGHAIADVLFGDVNPSAKLTTSFPRSVGQCPIYYNHKSTGRPHGDYEPYRRFTSCYIDVLNSPLYPFGYGLSYTTYEYSDVKLSSNTLKGDGMLTASVTVTNTGKREGKEIVQLYIHDVCSASTRPVKELRGFQKISLKPGESKDVIFTLSADDLKYYNHALEYVCEPGDFEVMIGSNSRDVETAKFTYVE